MSDNPTLDNNESVSNNDSTSKNDLLAMMEGLEDLENSERKDVPILRSIGWPGGKSRSLKYLLPRLPIRKCWADVFGGSGVVTLNRPVSKFESYNDLNSGVTSLFRVLQDDTLRPRLLEKLELTIHSYEEWVYCKKHWQSAPNRVDRALMFLYVSEYSFGCIGRNFGRSKGTSTLAGKLVKKIPRLLDIAKRFRNVQIDCMDYRDFIDYYDSKDTVLYCDPDYLTAHDGVYKEGMNYQDHIELLDKVMNGQGFFAVSSYPNELYDSYDWDETYEWESFVSIDSLNIGNKSNISHYKRDFATEKLYIRDN